MRWCGCATHVEVEETELATRFPAAILLFLILLEELLERYTEEWGGGDVVWEGRKTREGIAHWRRRVV